MLQFHALQKLCKTYLKTTEYITMRIRDCLTLLSCYACGNIAFVLINQVQEFVHHALPLRKWSGPPVHSCHLTRFNGAIEFRRRDFWNFVDMTLSCGILHINKALGRAGYRFPRHKQICSYV